MPPLTRVRATLAGTHAEVAAREQGTASAPPPGAAPSSLPG